MRQEQDVRGFWNRTYDRLIERRTTVGDLAAAIGVSYNIIPNWKSKGRYPQVEYLVPMSDFLEVSIDYLLTGQERRSRSLGDRLYEEMMIQAPAVLQGLIDTYIEKKDSSSAMTTA